MRAACQTDLREACLGSLSVRFRGEGGGDAGSLRRMRLSEENEEVRRATGPQEMRTPTPRDHSLGEMESGKHRVIRPMDRMPES